MYRPLSQVGKARDCNSLIVGSNPTGASICPYSSMDRALVHGTRNLGSSPSKDTIKIFDIFKKLYYNNSVIKRKETFRMAAW